MSLRQMLNRWPTVATGGAIALLIAAGLFAITRVRQETGGATPLRREAFFTSDDGKTWFNDDVTKVPPYQTAEGKTAVKAHVFRCPHEKTFVGYLERYSAQGQKAQAATPNPTAGGRSPYGSYGRGGAYAGGSGGPPPPDVVEVKAPGQGRWVSLRDVQAAAQIINPTCPDGGSAVEEIVP